MNQQYAIEILDLLHQAYPEAHCALHHQTVYQLLVAVTLSAQTTDVSVNRVSGTLFEHYPDPYAMARADQQDVMEMIRSIGLYQTKSRRIIDQARMIVQDYAGQVPEDDALLQKLPGVGRKTANVVMADGFGHQRIAVDTHVFRVSNRIGLAHAGDVRETERQLQQILPQKRWTEAHHSIIFHGRQCCTARAPSCRRCPIREYCGHIGV